MTTTGGGRPKAARRPSARKQPHRRRGSLMFSPTRGRSAQKMIIVIMVLGVVAAAFAMGIGASIGN